MNIFIVGLGNPGQGYELTRHNVGYRAIQYLQKKYKLHDFQNMKTLHYSVGEQNRNKLIAVLPLTFVNRSGEAVKEITKKFALGKKIIRRAPQPYLPFLLIHDDNDLPVGKLKMSIGKSSGGHKGVESIIKALKTQDFIRLRIGIQPLRGKHKKAEQIVLKEFSPDEERLIKNAVKKAAETAMVVAAEGTEKAYNFLSL